MTTLPVKMAFACAAGLALCAFPISIGHTVSGKIGLSVDAAQARIGRPMTPMSGAGVARRTYRRGAYGAYGAYGAGVYAPGVYRGCAWVNGVQVCR